jgi:hypothetical protein
MFQRRHERTPRRRQWKGMANVQKDGIPTFSNSFRSEFGPFLQTNSYTELNRATQLAINVVHLTVKLHLDSVSR